MDIAWIGHAAFRLRGRDVAVVMDPAPSSTGFRLNRPQADIVTVSNPDPRYAWVKGVGGDPIHLNAPGEYEIQNILVTGVTDIPERPKESASPDSRDDDSDGDSETDSAETDATPPAPPPAVETFIPSGNIAFVVTIDDIVIAHLGDMRKPPRGEALEEISRADVMLVPVGGHGHMDANMAAILVASIAPKIVIPMLYQAGPEKETLDPVAPFLKAVGGAVPGELDNHINITHSALPNNTTVHVLAPRGD
jgi:hypothetical protein